MGLDKFIASNAPRTEKFTIFWVFRQDIPVIILLKELFRVFRFSKACFISLTSSLIIFLVKPWRHLGTEAYGALPKHYCNFTNKRWNYAPKVMSNLSPMMSKTNPDLHAGTIFPPLAGHRVHGFASQCDWFVIVSSFCDWLKFTLVFVWPHNFNGDLPFTQSHPKITVETSMIRDC